MPNEHTLLRRQPEGEMKSEYKKLRQYVEAVKRNNPAIQNILKSYGDKETKSI